MNVSVDNARCMGHARCNAIAPEVYGLDEDGYCVIGQPQVPAGLEEAARDGSDSCPEQAITATQN